MRKFYSIFTLMIATLTSLVASAESRTVKIHIDEPSRITEIKCGDYGVDKVYTLDDNNCVEVTFGTNKTDGDIQQLNIFVIPDAEIVDLKYGDGTSPKFEGGYGWSKPVDNRKSYIYFTGYGTYDGFSVVDGADLYLETKALPSKVLSFTGDPAQMMVEAYNATNYKFEELEQQEAGVWSVNGNAVSQIRVSSLSGYLISSIDYTEGTETGTLSYSTMVTSKTIYSSGYNGDTSFAVATIGEEDARTASITVKMPADADVTILRNGKNIELSNAAVQTIKFNPLNDEKKFKVTRKSDATRKLYELTYTPAGDGNAQTGKGVASFSFDATNGGVLEINPEFPDVSVPVHFSFVNEGTQESITGVKVNGVAVENGAWMASDFSVKLSDKIELVQDKENYEFTGNWISVNGVASSNNTFEVLDDKIEGGYQVAITSRKFVMRSITIIAPAHKYLDTKVVICPNPSQYWNTIETPVEFNEEGVAVVEIPETTTMINFPYKSGLANYITRKVLNYDTEEVIDLSFGVSNGQVKNENLVDGMTLYCNVEKKRAEKAYIFLEDANWVATDIMLDFESPFEQVVALEPDNYTEVTFAKSNGGKTTDDFTENTFYNIIPEEGKAVYYLNDVKLEADDNGEISFAAMQAGDILKVYAEEKQPCNVSYEIKEGINVAITYDVVKSLDEIESHTVLPGTVINITPIATLADNDTSNVVRVICNGKEVMPNENGVFAVKVTADSKIKVTDEDSSVGLGSIASDDDDSTPTYDLQGRRVSNSAKGLVIKGGKVQIRK